MKSFATMIAILLLSAFVAAQEPIIVSPWVQPQDYKFTSTAKWAPRVGPNGHRVFFTPRVKMMKADNAAKFTMKAVPATTLPVDCTGNMAVSVPMYGNDQYGDCGEAMCAHADQILTFSQGKLAQSTFDQNTLVKQYLKISGGDNGMDESMVVGAHGVWRTGIAGNSQAVMVDYLHIDPTNIAALQYAVDQFYTVEMAWSVPDDFINKFTTGASFLAAGVPNPQNGHYTPITDIDVHGNMRIITWGSWCWASQKFLASVEPVYFVAFSPRQFMANGYDSHGRHIQTQAAVWVASGGKAIPASIISAFPPPTPNPVPVPTPTPTPTPTPSAQTITLSGFGLFDGTYKLSK